MSAVKKVVIVSTCERPGRVCYLWDLLRGLGPLPHGVRGVLLCDGEWGHPGPGGPAQFPQWELPGYPERGGSRRNLWRALQRFVETDADELLFLEDDAAPCRGALQRALALRVPDGAAFLALYDGSAVDEMNGSGQGLHWRSVLGPARTGFWGTVAMVIPRRTAEWLLKRDPVHDAPRHAGKTSGSDVALGGLLSLSPWPEYAIHVPGLFDHRGDVSAAHPGETLRPHRVARNLLPAGEDAAALPPVGAHDDVAFPDRGSLSLAVVFATYNRRALLERAVASIRGTLYGRWAEIVVVDGGSTDGSREWLAAQSDVVLVAERGPLDGAVRAFNLGYRCALERGHEFVGHLNDDAEAVDLHMWERAVETLRRNQRAGAVAFRFDLRGKYQHEFVHGKPYVNFGVMRAQAIRDVSLAQGGREYERYWNPIYRTYGADCEASCNMWRLGWEVLTSDDRVHDVSCDDGLRRGNTVGQKDSELFWSRWADPKKMELVR